MTKSKNKIRVSFVGTNNISVTGSMTHIQMDNYQILLETGLYQSNNNYEDYKINSRKFDFKPKEIDYILIGHVHIDHIGILPRLYAQGCKAKIIAPIGTSKLFKIMGADSAFISGRDVETFERKYKKQFSPIYTQEDVENCLQYFEEYDYNEKIKLNDNIEFNFKPSGHIICAAQIELWLTQNNHTSKILYTSDLGNINTPKYYVENFESVNKANLVIGECTYSDRTRSVKYKDRIKDLEKIKSVINTICLENGHKVLIPIFALDRCQNILTHLYDMYGKDEDFKVPILIDSPLAIKLTMLYKSLLKDEQLEKFKEVLSWGNILFVEEYEDSKNLQNLKQSMIILSASGFMQAGRARQWAKVLLPDSQSHILFCGYSSENSLAGKIKNCRKQKTITIDGKPIPNRCGITSLNSFTSHIQYDDLLKYYSDINAEKIALVHSEYNSKLEFAKELQEEISRKNKTGKVIAVNKNTELLL